MVLFVAVKRLILLIVVIIATTLLFFATTDSSAVVAGMPLACTDGRAPCWIGVGGPHVIAVGVGAGLVEFGYIGVGLLFATGQAAVGMIALGQMAVAITCFVGQAGTGLCGMGQGGLGLLVHDGADKHKDAKAFFVRLGADLNDLLRIVAPPIVADESGADDDPTPT